MLTEICMGLMLMMDHMYFTYILTGRRVGKVNLNLQMPRMKSIGTVFLQNQIVLFG